MLIGYIRVRQGNEDALLAQRRTLQDAGCEQLVEDLASAGQRDQPELRRMVDQLREDNLVVSRLGCLGGSLQDVARTVQRVAAASTGVRSLAEAIDTTTPSGRAAAQMIGHLAELDRTAVRDRINTGLAAARRGTRRRSAPEADGAAVGKDRGRGALGPEQRCAHGAAAQGERADHQPPVGRLPDRRPGARHDGP